jgi:hypothetical protein
MTYHDKSCNAPGVDNSDADLQSRSIITAFEIKKSTATKC